MNCIFCHEISDGSKTVEHIVPESLGNKDTILWKGAVCDKCNNYFGTNIEHPLLNQSYFISLRHRNFIYNKKNKPVRDKKLFLGENGGWLDTQLTIENGNLIISLDENDKLFDYISAGNINQMILPIIKEPAPNNYHLSRFLAKCALEYLVFRLGEENFIEFSNDIKNLPEIQNIRQYARYAKKGQFWQYHQRRIYGEGDVFTNNDSKEPYQVLTEMDLLVIPHWKKLDFFQNPFSSSYYFRQIAYSSH